MKVQKRCPRRCPWRNRRKAAAGSYTGNGRDRDAPVVSERLEARDRSGTHTRVVTEDLVLSYRFGGVRIAVDIGVDKGEVGHVEEALHRAKRVAVVVVGSNQNLPVAVVGMFRKLAAAAGSPSETQMYPSCSTAL